MADQAARTKDDNKPRSPNKSKVVRSQKISQATSPTDGTSTTTTTPTPLDAVASTSTSSSTSTSKTTDAKPDSSPRPDNSNNESRDRAQPIPRSHTPGHLASKSQDRRRKPSDLSDLISIRQRSQSAVSTAPPTAAATATATATPTPQTSTSTNPPVSLKTLGPSSSSLRAAPRPNGASAASLDAPESPEHTRPNSSAGSKDGSTSNGRRPTNLRSTSAIASKSGPATASSTGNGPISATSSAGGGGGGGGDRSASGSIRQASSSATSRNTPTRAHQQQHQSPGYTAFPPLADSRTAPDVPPAPSSGMYWSRAPVSGHPHTALRAHTTTIVGSNVYVFGGCDSRACFNELYVLDADAFYWSAPFVSGETPVPLRAMTCTAVGKKLVIFGGGDGPAYYNDVYVLDTVNFRWSRPRIVGDRAPSKRRAHTACLYKNGIYVFGGGDGVRALNDIWRLDVSDVTKMSWKLISGPSNEKNPATGKDVKPKARGYHTANMVGSKLIIFGGSDGGECFNDVWVYDVDSHVWKAVAIPITFRRLSHTATIVGSYLFVIGGHDGNEYSNDVLLLNLVTMTWDKRKVYGLPPSGRGYHGTILYDSRLMMIGGFDGSEVFGDVWILELAVHAYYSQISHFSIEV